MLMSTNEDTWRHNPEYHNPKFHRRENLKSKYRAMYPFSLPEAP
jgi:hypothetical protein